MVAISDPRYDLQWHFGLIGDIATVWEAVSGQGVQVAVYDDGMDQLHEDLYARYDASLHYAGLGFDDGPHNSMSDGHGTAVGGLADFIAGFGEDDVLIAQDDDLLSGVLYTDRFVFAADGAPSRVTVTDLEVWDVLEFNGFGAVAVDLRAAMVQQGPDVVPAAAGESLIFLDTQLAEIGEIVSLG